MELLSIASPTHASTVLIGNNYDIMLKESIERFTSEIQRGITDFSGFSSIFFRLLHARLNPPLETIWFYSAAQFRSIEVDKDDIFSRISRTKDLFQLLTSSSASCNGLKSVAVVCPVLFELYHVIVELWGRQASTKGERKVWKEIECLVEGVLGYINVCGCEDYGNDDNGSEDLLPCFTELIRVWTIDQGNVEVGDSLNVFFPLVSDEIREGFWNGEFGVGYLVGVVIVQAFLLRLCLKFRAGAGLSKLALQNELSSWAVGSITAFRNCCFFEVLLRLLLESTLPVTSILDSKDEAFLQKVLYDVVILVDYSFLNIESQTMLTSKSMNRLAVRKLILAHEATQEAREKGDHTKAISYINAFSRSSLPSTLLKWVTGQIGIYDETSKPNATTPQAFLKWLLILDGRGVKLFDDNSLKLRAKLAADESKSGYEHRVLQPNSNLEDDLLFYIDNKPEGDEKKADDQEMVESINDKRNKRKGERKGDKKKKVKFLKYNLHDKSAKEVPISDEDEDMVEV